MFEWHWSESTEKPDMVDTTSSRDYVYVRKDFQEFEREEITYWKYQEKLVPKADWDIYRVAMENQSDVTDIQDALCELYEMIIGGDE